MAIRIHLPNMSALDSSLWTFQQSTRGTANAVPQHRAAGLSVERGIVFAAQLWTENDLQERVLKPLFISGVLQTRLRSHWQTSVMCFAGIMYLRIPSVFPGECTWLLLRSVPTAPPDVWHVILSEHMVASADAVLYIPSPVSVAGKC